MSERRSGRGNNQHRDQRPAGRVRLVGVSFSEEELACLDSMRGGMQRAPFLRAMLFGRAPRPIPAINRDAWVDLGRALGNLSAVATAMRAGHYSEIEEVRQKVADLRMALVGASFNEVSSDGGLENREPRS